MLGDKHCLQITLHFPKKLSSFWQINSELNAAVVQPSGKKKKEEE